MSPITNDPCCICGDETEDMCPLCVEYVCDLCQYDHMAEEHPEEDDESY